VRAGVHQATAHIEPELKQGSWFRLARAEPQCPSCCEGTAAFAGGVNDYLTALGLENAPTSPAQPSRLQRVSSRGANTLSGVMRPTLAPNGVQLSNLKVNDNLEVRARMRSSNAAWRFSI
jgi:hypothetical protein